MNSIGKKLGGLFNASKRNSRNTSEEDITRLMTEQFGQMNQANKQSKIMNKIENYLG